MRAMIVAAGLGTRMRPLTELRPKPAVPVRGIPLVAYPLALLAASGAREVVINVHHLPEVLADAAERFCPEGLELRLSHEPDLLDTGGAIRRVREFLRESDPVVLLGGDMILDVDLRGLVKRHCESGRAVTLLLREDPRAPAFGTIGVDDRGRVRRIAGRFDLGGEVRCGIYTWANVVSARALDDLPEREVFSHLDDWIAPLLASGAEDVGAEVLDESECSWEPVGNLPEYLAANLREHHLSYLDADRLACSLGAVLEEDRVLGPGAVIGTGARLERAVVWDGEQVPDGFCGHDGVFAGGRFHPCLAQGVDGS